MSGVKDNALQVKGVGDMAKNLEISTLLDYYGMLLTDKQRETAEYSYTTVGVKVTGRDTDLLENTEYAIAFQPYQTESSVEIPVTQNGKVAAGEWIDVIRFRDWLQEEITVNVFNALINRDKIPYTDEGIAVIEAQIRKALQLGVRRGGIAPDEYDEDGNTNLGYTVEVPLAASISANQKASRVLNDVKFTARLAGAIHVVKITGSLTYENLIKAQA